MTREDRYRRVVVRAVRPEIDGGRFPIKRVVGDRVVVEADVYADGHDAVACVLRHRHDRVSGWQEARMAPLGNDRWRGSFVASGLGSARYTIEGWLDPFATWRGDLRKRVGAGRVSPVDIRVGVELVERAATRAETNDAERLRGWARALRNEDDPSRQHALALDDELGDLACRHPDRSRATRYDRELGVTIDPPAARFGSWYEMFPRSCATEPGRHGTLRDVEARLDYVAAMGFDILYLPPIHPIGSAFRRGKNDTADCEPDDVGSPWAIGSPAGGHTAIHPDLGSFDDLERLVRAAAARKMAVALDIAFQCAPDHPYVTQHPAWFRRRPDGTIQYAENPPKRYQDIYPIEFENEDREALWSELSGVITFWIARGIRIFRVDNPHTKPFRFWEWLIAEIKREHPDVVFLAEAFTRPRIMYELAKLGFTQSYTYFTWRNTKQELTDYFTELTQRDVAEFFRPNLWPNTPDILHEYLQVGGRPAFIVRLVLAGTLGASYGIYGPAFELCENTPRTPSSEEYRDSEKYQIRPRDLDASWSLRDLIARVNRARRENPALQRDDSLRFHDVDNDALICYSKAAEDGANVVLVVVNLDATDVQAGWVSLDLGALGVDPDQPFQVHDLLGDGRYLWQGPRNYVELDPHVLPAHVFRVRRDVRSERDVDYDL